MAGNKIMCPKVTLPTDYNTSFDFIYSLTSAIWGYFYNFQIRRYQWLRILLLEMIFRSETNWKTMVGIRRIGFHFKWRPKIFHSYLFLFHNSNNRWKYLSWRAKNVMAMLYRLGKYGDQFYVCVCVCVCTEEAQLSSGFTTYQLWNQCRHVKALIFSDDIYLGQKRIYCYLLFALKANLIL